MYCDQHDGFELVKEINRREAGLRAIVVIRSTALGAALGGVRMMTYANYGAAEKEVLRLAETMDRKAAMARVRLRGGACVVIGDPAKQKNIELLQTLGEEIHKLDGKIKLAADTGIHPEDIAVMRLKTPYVLGGPRALGTPNVTARRSAEGVLYGMQAAVSHARLGNSLRGLRVAVQGLGEVGRPLVELLHAEGAHLVLTSRNMNEARKLAEEYLATAVEPDEIYSVDCDVLAPCLNVGGTLNQQTIPKLHRKLKVVCGATNMQLADDEAGEMLYQRSITFAPDFVVNAGGLISVSGTAAGQDVPTIEARLKKIYHTTAEVLEEARLVGLPPHRVANRLADERTPQQ